MFSVWSDLHEERMEDNAVLDTPAKGQDLRLVRRRRKYFFGTVLAYIPALLITHRISPTHYAMGLVFVVWVVALIISTFLSAITRCPRCGNFFHVNGMTLLYLRRCLHCQLHINSDRVN